MIPVSSVPGLDEPIITAGTAEGELADEGEVGAVHGNQGGGQETILLVEVEQLGERQSEQDDRCDYVDPQRISAGVSP